jgi:hypothetical protein
MLSFLNPWLWFGLLALGAPLWLHLRRKERENIIRFSTLRFLEDQPIARQSPLRLKNLLLLVLRLLAVAAFTAAFAQPFLAQKQIPTSSSEVYVLDNTLSRQAEQGLERDRAFIIHQIQIAGPHTQTAVVELTDKPRVLVGFGDGAALAEAKLNALQPSNKRGALVAALREANSLIQQSIGEHKHITVLTDLQENQWEENSGAPPFLAPGLVTLAPNSGLDNRPNFFVGEPHLQRVFLGDRALVQFTAVVGHSGDVKTGTIKIVVNGQDILKHDISLDGKTDQVSIAAQWENDPSIWLTGAITVTAEPDDLPQDNTAYFTLPPVTEGRVALLTQSTFIKTALSAAVARGHWAAQILQPSDLSGVSADPSRSDADVLMVDADYLQARQGRDLVDRYANSGRGVFIMMGRNSPLLLGFLQQLGFEPELEPSSNLPPALQPIRYFASESPIFLPFSVPDFGNLSEVRIGTPVHLRAVTGKPLLFSQKGDGLLFDVSREKGRMLLSTFAFDRDHTDWVVHPSFVPFLDAALQFLRPQPQLNQTLEPGEIWLAQLPFDSAVTSATLRDFSGKPLYQVPIQQELHRVTLHAPDDPGVYSLTYDTDPTVQQMLAVNPSLKESDLRYLAGTPDVLKAWTLTAAPPAPASEPGAVLPIAAQAAQQTLWWTLLLAGSLALVIEMLWQSRRGQSA